MAVPPNLTKHGPNAEGFGQAILEVLRTATGSITAGELRRRVGEECTSSGMRAPTQARLWRHLVRVERFGRVTREVRVGGTGGRGTQIFLARRWPQPGDP